MVAVLRRVATKLRDALKTSGGAGRRGPIRTVVSWPARRVDDIIEGAFGKRLFSGGLARLIPFGTFIIGAAMWLFLYRFVTGMM